ncbi:hypothetical protein Syun_006290 [Stephania yunnanensis]|uniref:Uncharacterized protein n=1 Tax=Stephania yunnanensis TaxID=152371 RepID=A0AAP0KXZ5_9MAGN
MESGDACEDLVKKSPDMKKKLRDLVLKQLDLEEKLRDLVKKSLDLKGKSRDRTRSGRKAERSGEDNTGSEGKAKRSGRIARSGRKNTSSEEVLGLSSSSDLSDVPASAEVTPPVAVESRAGVDPQNIHCNDPKI